MKKTMLATLVQNLRENVPSEVKASPFCCWKRQFVKGRVTKVPYNPRTGWRAQANRPETFGTFEEAMAMLKMRKYDGIGILVSGNVAALDIDHCMEDGKLNALASSVLGILKDCYIEVSPSGTGLRGFFTVPDGFDYDKNQYYIKHGDLELYIPGMTNRFVTVTGNVYRAGSAVDESEALQTVLDTFMKRENTITELSDDFEPHSYLSDEEVLIKASQDKKFRDCFDGDYHDHFPSQSEADLFVLGTLAFYCGGDMEQMDHIFESSALMREKFANDQGLTAYGENTIKRAVAGRKEFYDPEHYKVPAEEDFEEVLTGDEVNTVDDGRFLPNPEDKKASYTFTDAGNCNPSVTEVIPEDKSVGDLSASEGGRHTEPAYVKNDGESFSHPASKSTTEKPESDENDSDCYKSMDTRLDAFLASNPTVSDLYTPDNLVLAAYAKVTRPADYEVIRSFVRDKHMGMKLYEQEVRKKETAVRQKREERIMQQAIRSEENKHGRELPPFVYFSKKAGCFKVDAAKLAIYVKKNLTYILVQNDLRNRRVKYVYDHGVYRMCSDECFKGYIMRFVEEYDPALVQMKDIDEVLRNISSGLKSISFERLNTDENIINFRNGLLYLDTMELKPHDPKVYTTIQIDCDWTGEESATPVFDDYIATLTDFDPDIEKLILQFMGVTLSNVAGGRYKKALFLYGDGNTGKSQLKCLLEKIVGRDNFAAVDLPELETQFGASAIYGKRLAGTADMTFLTIRELKNFKCMTGGDFIKVEFKGENQFSYQYKGMLMFCMNKKPKFGGDDGKWVYNRIMLVHCPNAIPEAKQDHKLLDKLYEEREGIVYHAVLALKETIDNGYQFTEPDCVTEARTEYRNENNSVIQFVEQCMEEREKPAYIENIDHDTLTNVHRIYVKWCRYNNNGHHKSLKEFKKSYAEYVGLPENEAIIRRKGGMYLANHRITEAGYDYLLSTDREMQRTFVQADREYH